jgi:hypothetical protein
MTCSRYYIILFVRIIRLSCSQYGRDEEPLLGLSLKFCTFSQHAYARDDSSLFLYYLRGTSIVAFR